MSRIAGVSAALLAISLCGVLLVMAAEPPIADIRQQAVKEYQAGNYRDAYEALQKVIASSESQGEPLLSDLEMAITCLQQLQRNAEQDTLLAKAIEAHSGDWRLLWKAAEQLQQMPHYGFMVAGEFRRGNARGGGAYVDVSARDRVQSLMWMNQAQAAMPADADADIKSQFYLSFAGILLQSNGEGWRLQTLTNLETLPDYPEATEAFRGRWMRAYSDNRGAPVDENGNPIYYSVPSSFADAKNDGERWRWCLLQAAEMNPARRGETILRFADFLRSQFGVQTLRNFGIVLPSNEDGDSEDKTDGIWSLPSLSEDETIARLADGVKRFKLPEEFQFIRLYRELAAEMESPRAQDALQRLAIVFQDRQQFAKAAAVLQESLTRFPKDPDGRQGQLTQITGNWGTFEAASGNAAGSGAQVNYRYRNGNSVTFTARRIKVSEFLADIQSYLASRPAELDWNKIQVGQIGMDILQKNNTKYLGEEVANWTLKLDPRPEHFDRRVTVTTPLQSAGAYFVKAQMADGNQSHIVLWVNDTAIVRKQISNQVLYYVADAVTGEPLPDMQLEFFGWRQEYQENSRKHRLSTQKFAERTNRQGMVAIGERLMPPRYQWITIAKSSQGKSNRLAWLGFQGVWFERVPHELYAESKIYFVTDRPVYRPDQKVEFKLWIRQAKYGEVDNQLYANKPFTVQIEDSQGVKVYQETLTTDEYGGLQGTYSLPKQAGLGQYVIQILDAPFANGLGTFRVEEYKKPEFEVTIQAPEKPVQLGDKITATIQAKYYYGAPVTQATVKFKVERSAESGTWFPVDRWDWLYGNGYWWFAPESNWYPGFRAWGCFPPLPGWSDEAPELVLERELPMGPDGTVNVEIDTALAKLLHGNQDHRYSIQAEVTDASRRIIVGTGKVLVSRQPYRIYSWTNRGYYQVGDTIEATFQARALDGKGVQGSGKLDLLKISYTDGQPVESVVQTWDLSTNEQGTAKQTLKSSEPGQYRLSFKMQTAKDAPVIEGGYLFTVRGSGFDGSQFRFNDLEVIADKKTYAPGEKVKLLINTNRTNSTVLLFIRPVDGIAKSVPQLIALTGKSQVVEIDVAANDMPNFFVEALTVSNGKVFDEVRDLAVPPESRVLTVEVIPSAQKYQPGASADVQVKVTDPEGKPVVGSVVLSAYDRAVEYISGGSNVPNIQEYFWKWKRHHDAQTIENLDVHSSPLNRANERTMQPLGAFGDLIADLDGVVKQRNSHGGMGGMGGGMGGFAMPAAAPQAEMALDARSGGLAKSVIADEAATVTPQIRSEFADTAFWKANLVTDSDGVAHVQFDMPENLTGWKLRAWGLGNNTRVGEGSVEVVTAKNIVVRLQAPRFFVERDEVVLSAVVHNYLETEKEITVQLELAGETLELFSGSEFGAVQKDLSTKVTVAAGGEARVDWLVKAIQPGTATVTMKALTNEESDAMQMTFPVEVHGILKTESFAGVIRPNAETGKLEFTVPEDRQPEQSRLEVRYSPSLASAMVDALPYLAAYPYGCTEQTLNRFVPTVITQQVLLQMGVNLKEIQEKRTNLNSQQLGDPKERAAQWKRFEENPIFDQDELDLMVKTGVKDLTSMQNSDGGWGWFSGVGERSYPHTTGIVVHGLQIAAKNNVAIAEGVLQNGIAWLTRAQNAEVALLQEGERHEKDTKRKEKYKTQASDLDAFVFNVLVESGVANPEMQRFLYRDRNKLSLYSQALLGLALHELKAIEQRDMVIKNIDQFLKVDEENQTAYIDLPNANWWYWYGSRVEANAFYLKLLTKVNPQDTKAAGLAKYLINNRRHGTYWNNTRDTAYAIEALAEYAVASGETKPNMLVEVWLDGELKASVEITPEVLFTFNNTFVVEGKNLTSGKHVLELRRRPLNGDGTPTPLYFNAYVTNFTKEDNIAATGLEIKVDRKFYRLIEDKDATSTVRGARGQAIDQKVVKYTRQELKSLAEVVSGDLIEIELKIDSKNDYEYIVFEDFKAAGCEPVDLQSGYTRGGLGAYVEFRDQKVAFFLQQLNRGTHSVSYRVRAEIPGKFSALPTMGFGMYAPELKANSDEMKLRIDDRKN